VEIDLTTMVWKTKHIEGTIVIEDSDSPKPVVSE